MRDRRQQRQQQQQQGGEKKLKRGEKPRPKEPHFSNPAARFYDPTDDFGLKAYFPTPDYSDRILETQLREHAPWGYRPLSITDPATHRRSADAERRVRERLGFTRVDQLAVKRSVGVASLLNANLTAAPRRPDAHPAAWAYASDQDTDTSLGRDLHRISEELDVTAVAAASAAAAVAEATADAAEIQQKKAARAAERELREYREKAHREQRERDLREHCERELREKRELRSLPSTAVTMPTNEYQGKSARAIAGKLMMESVRNLCLDRSATALGLDQEREAAVVASAAARARRIAFDAEEEVETTTLVEDRTITQYMDALKRDIRGIQTKSHEFLEGTSKQTAIEIEQLNARVVEAETKLKTEVTRIKKKMQMTITELEMSLDVANKNNLQLQMTIKKQSLQLTELQAHYDETQRQLAVTLDQYGIAQRRLQSLTSELEEVRANCETALRAKRTVEQAFEEAQSRINELTTINVNLAGARSKLEQELGTLAGDYEEVTKELRIADERYQRVQVELKHTVETLHEEQERVIKIETIKKSLEIEVKNLSVRLEEVEANAIVGGKRIISKLEARMRDLELELDEEKRRHAETIKILRKKERHVKEVLIQNEEDQKNISLLQEMLDKTTAKVNIYKRQLNEQEGMSQQSVTRVRRFQRELEAAEDRAENAESNLSLIRAKHRTFVTTSTVPGSQVYMVQETRSSSETY